jgi:hypothetical protein
MPTTPPPAEESRGGGASSSSPMATTRMRGRTTEPEPAGAALAKPQGFLTSLLRRGWGITSTLSSQLGMASSPNWSQLAQTPAADIFEPYPPATNTRDMEELARRNEDRMILRIHDELEKDNASRGAEETAYKERDFNRESEEMQLANTIETLFEQAHDKFSLGTAAHSRAHVLSSCTAAALPHC